MLTSIRLYTDIDRNGHQIDRVRIWIAGIPFEQPLSPEVEDEARALAALHGISLDDYRSGNAPRADIVVREPGHDPEPARAHLELTPAEGAFDRVNIVFGDLRPTADLPSLGLRTIRKWAQSEGLRVDDLRQDLRP